MSNTETDNTEDLEEVPNLDEILADEWVEDQSLPDADPALQAESDNPDGADLGVALAAVVVSEFLGRLMSTMDGGAQAIVIGVSNYTDHILSRARYATNMGAVSQVNPNIGSSHLGTLSALSRPGLNGTAGVLTYKINGTSDQLAIMWQVPKLFTKSNWFKFAVVPESRKTDKKLFKDMWDGTKTPGQPRKANVGEMRWHNSKFKYSGTMGSASKSIMTVEFRKK